MDPRRPIKSEAAEKREQARALLEQIRAGTARCYKCKQLLSANTDLVKVVPYSVKHPDKPYARLTKYRLVHQACKPKRHKERSLEKRTLGLFKPT